MATEAATATPADTTADPWSPCRRHLMDLVFAVPVRVRERGHWRTTPAVWERIRKDREFASNWNVAIGGPSLFDLPVHLNGRHDAIELILPADCRSEN